MYMVENNARQKGEKWSHFFFQSMIKPDLPEMLTIFMFDVVQTTIVLWHIFLFLRRFFSTFFSHFLIVRAIVSIIRRSVHW